MVGIMLEGVPGGSLELLASGKVELKATVMVEFKSCNVSPDVFYE